MLGDAPRYVCPFGIVVMTTKDRIAVSPDTRRRLKRIKADRDARSYDQVLQSILDEREGVEA